LTLSQVNKVDVAAQLRGMVYNNIISHEDWMPTLLAAAGDANVVQKVAEGYKLGDSTFNQHLDGYNFLPFWAKTLST
jgi:arylsulfatase A-like enzyme